MTATEHPSSHMQVTLPTGRRADMTVSNEVAVVRVDDRACVAHPRWMTRDQMERMVADAQAVLDRWEHDSG